MPAPASTSASSSVRSAWWSWFPSTAKIGTSRCRHAPAITSACSGSPLVVRSPARRTTSASPWRSANARSTRSALTSEAWMSAAAAIVTTASCCAIGQSGNDPTMPEPTFEELLDAMKTGAGALQRKEIPFVLGGGLAAWARGGPKSEHDVDFMIRPQDADAALDAMEEAGLRTERPPEGWLYKAWHENGTLIDLIFAPSGGPITDETIESAQVLEG